jgi:hypothetical protein
MKTFRVATSVLALLAALPFAGGAAAQAPIADGPTHVLFFNDGTHAAILPAQTFEAAMADADSAVADDFEVPAGDTWLVMEVDVKGAYVPMGAGPAHSWHVTIYRNKGGKPGNAIADYDNLQAMASDAEVAPPDTIKPQWIAIAIPRTKLRAERYWLSVVANLNSDGSDGSNGGQWGQYTILEANAGVAKFENPGNHWQTGCTSWGSLPNCWGPVAGNGAYFKVKGKLFTGQ